MKQSLLKILSVSFSLLLLVTIGCNKNPVDTTSSTDTPTSSETVKLATDNSGEIFTIVTSVNQVSDLLRGPDAVVELRNIELEDGSTPKSLAKETAQYVITQFSQDKNALAKSRSSNSDSLIWEFTKKKVFKGYTERVRFFYDFITGHAFAEVIRFDFDNRHRLAYDSTRINVDANFTLDDQTDDVLLALEILKEFKPGNAVASNWSRFIPDTYAPGTEPDGGVFDNKIIYQGSGNILSQSTKAEFHEGQGGSWNKDIQYADQTTRLESVTFNVDGTGTFEEQRRNGTKIEGTFDEAESDGTGKFTKLKTLPAGSDPESIYEEGTFTFNAADSTLEGSYSKEVRFKNGNVLSESIQIKESYANSVKVTEIHVTQNDGSEGDFTIEERLDGNHISGEWIEANGTFMTFTIFQNPGGSGQLEFAIYTSQEAFNNGEDPIASGVINFDADGSGSGLVDEGSIKHSVEISASDNE